MALKLEKSKKTPEIKEWCAFLGVLDWIVSEKESQQTYKAFVGKGNNSILIKSIIKSRPWWVLTQEAGEANLLWTQMKNQKCIDGLSKGNPAVKQRPET